MKKILLFLLATIMIFSFTACGGSPSEEIAVKEPSSNITTVVEDGITFYSVTNPEYLLLYKYDANVGGYTATDGVDLYVKDGVWCY